MKFDPLINWSLIFWLVIPFILVSLALSVRAMKKSALAQVLKPALLCRVFVFILAIGVLINPYTEIEKADKDNYVIGILSDVSFSMSAKDCRKQSRFKVMKEIRQKAPIFNHGEHRFVDASFAENYVASAPFEGTFEGGSAGGEALKQMLELYGESLGGLVFFSDGQINRGISLANAAAMARSMEVPVNVIGLGSVESVDDLSIEFTDPVKTVEKGRYFEIKTKLARNFTKAGMYQLRLHSGDRLIDERLVNFTEGELESVQDFRVRELASGIRHYKVELEAFEGEQLLSNNIDYMSCEVSGAKLKKIIWLSSIGKPEFRYFQHFISQQEGYELSGFMRLSSNRWVELGSENEKHSDLQLPDMSDYDVVILDNSFSFALSEEEKVLLKSFVQEKGGGLIGLGGEFSTDLADILPVEEVNFQYSSRRHALSLAETSVLYSKKQGDTLDLNGKLFVQSGQAVQLGSKLNRTARKDLSKADDFLLAAQPSGLGRLIWCGVDTWPWKLSSKSSESFYEVFWSRLIEWVSAGSRPLIQVHGAWQKYEQGAQGKIFIDLLDESFNPARSTKLKTFVRDPSGSLREWSLSASTEVDGRFDLALDTSQLGEYIFEVQDEEGGIKKTASFTVVPVAGESPALGLNLNKLKELAALSAGTYTSWNDAMDLKGMEIKQSVPSLIKKDYWFNLTLLMSLILLSLGLEWFLKRRAGIA